MTQDTENTEQDDTSLQYFWDHIAGRELRDIAQAHGMTDD